MEGFAIKDFVIYDSMYTKITLSQEIKYIVVNKEDISDVKYNRYEKYESLNEREIKNYEIPCCEDQNVYLVSIRNILLMNGTEILKGFSEIEIDNDKVFSPTKCSFTVKKDGSTFYLDIDRSEVKLNNEKYYSYNLANEDIDRLEYRAHKITMLSLSIEAYTIKSSGIFWTDLYIEKYNEKFERIMNQLLFEYKKECRTEKDKVQEVIGKIKLKK